MLARKNTVVNASKNYEKNFLKWNHFREKSKKFNLKSGFHT